MLSILICTFAFAGYKDKADSSPSTQNVEPDTSEAKNLLTRISEWQYTNSRMSGATASNATTVNAKGEITTPSIHCKTVLITADPIDKVFDYYKSKLAQNTVSKTGEETTVVSSRTSGRSVTFHSDSDGRPVEIHMILINSERMSTTLMISNGRI
jgi:hypothetical protein